ncbi:MAG: hypothetical protein AAFQ78_00695, partial [Bacteroidota bacterium]
MRSNKISHAASKIVALIRQTCCINCNNKKKTACIMAPIFTISVAILSSWGCSENFLDSPNGLLTEKGISIPPPPGTQLVQQPHNNKPTEQPNDKPTKQPNNKPTEKPNDEPTKQPNDKPTEQPNDEPTENPNDEQQSSKGPSIHLEVPSLGTPLEGGVTQSCPVTPRNNNNPVASKQPSTPKPRKLPTKEKQAASMKTLNTWKELQDLFGREVKIIYSKCMPTNSQRKSFMGVEIGSTQPKITFSVKRSAEHQYHFSGQPNASQLYVLNFPKLTQGLGETGRFLSFRIKRVN